MLWRYSFDAIGARAGSSGVPPATATRYFTTAYRSARPASVSANTFGMVVCGRSFAGSASQASIHPGNDRFATSVRFGPGRSTRPFAIASFGSGLWQRTHASSSNRSRPCSSCRSFAKLSGRWLGRWPRNWCGSGSRWNPGPAQNSSTREAPTLVKLAVNG